MIEFPLQSLSSPDQVTPQWLTAVLSTTSALTNGRVQSFTVDQGSGNWSTNAVLHINYAKGSRGELPPRLFLKMVKTVDPSDSDEFFGESEVTYYTRDYAGVEDAPLLRCYSAAYSAAQLQYHLLLDDVSETHVEAAQKAPTLEYGLALAEGLSVMHAHWWGAERLAEADAPIHDPQHIQRFVDIAQPGASHILGQFTSDLKPHWPDLLHDLFANHPRAIIARTQDSNGFTLIHGDAGHNNILVPRTGDRPIYIIDRQPFNWSLTTWLGVYDLAYAMVLDWDVETRRSLELPVLRRYHEWLVKNGVQDYAWERLYDDYRLCVPICVYVATEYCRGGINRRVDVWLPMLKRALTACDDVDCPALWSEENT